MNEDKAEAIEIGERAGEQYAMSVYETDGIEALAATLRPGEHEGYAKAFYELWKGGAEPWQDHAYDKELSVDAGVHRYYHRAHDEVFARGARRCAEMLVRGYLDARAGFPLELPKGDGVAEAKARLELLLRRTALGDRPALISAYETGHRLFTASREVPRG